MNKHFITKIVFALVLQFTLSSIPTTQVQATTAENYTEMGLALATIPFDMAGHHYATKNKAKRAATFYILRDIVSILNKAAYFHNYTNLTDQTSLLGMRDGMANGAFLIHDFVKLYQDFNLFRDNKKPKPTFFDTEADNVKAAIEKHEVSGVAYAWRVATLPLLKGLTAFTIALSQDESRAYSCTEERYSAASAHALTRLLDEYTELKSDSPHKKKLLTLIIVNAVWFAYELKQYISQKAHAEVSEETHLCGICDDEPVLQNTLGCGHATSCQSCLQAIINRAINNNDVLNLRCTHPGCNHTINIQEATIIMDNEANFAQRFNNAIAYIRHCPNNNCTAQFNNIGNRTIQHDCPECHQSYCARCLVPHQNNQENCLEALRRINPELENYLEEQENQHQWKRTSARTTMPWMHNNT